MPKDARIWLKSYDRGVSPEVSIPPVTYLNLLEQTFSDFRSQTACWFLETSLSFQDVDRYTLSFANCRICLSGAAPFDLESMKTLEAVAGQGKIVEVYGLTETFILTMNPYRGAKKTGSVGLPLPSTRIKIVDLDRGEGEVPLTQEGQLIAQGPQIMQGYYHQPAETARALRKFQGETWMFTGDVARMDEDGYVTIVDRAKDMMIVGGYKVFSCEVEEILYAHPAVTLCAVVGEPDRARPGSQRATAIIQPAGENKEVDFQDLEDELISHCRENLAPYKIPRKIEIVENLPLTPVGKVDKKRLKFNGR